MEEENKTEEKILENVVVESSVSQTAFVSVKEASNMDSISLLFKKSWDLFEKRFWKLVGVSIVPLILIFLVSMIFAGGMLLSIVSGSLFLMPIFMVLGLLFIIVAIWAKVAILFTIKDSEEKIGIKESFKRSKKYIAPYFLVSILVALVSFGGMIIFIIPGIIVGIMIMFAVFVLVNEDTRGIDALIKSREYVRGHWWPIFGRVLLIGLIFFALSIIPLLGALISILFLTPFMMVYMFIMYKNLKEIKGEVFIDEAKQNKTKNKLTVFLILGIIAIPMLIIFAGSIPFLLSN